MYTWILVFLTVFLKNRSIISKIKRSKLQTMQLLAKIPRAVVVPYTFSPSTKFYLKGVTNVFLYFCCCRCLFSFFFGGEWGGAGGFLWILQVRGCFLIHW